MKNKSLIIFCFCAFAAYGQDVFRPSMYFRNMNYYNVAAGPADTTADRQASLYGKYKLIENDVWQKPANIFASYLGNCNRLPGFYSAGYLYDGYSFYDRHSIYAGYTYEWKLAGTNKLSAGVRGIFNFDRVQWDKLSQVDKSGSDTYFTPDLDVGVQYQVKGFTLGFSSKNLASNAKRIDGEVLLKNQREWYSNISYAFNIRQKFTIAPYMLLYRERKSGLEAGLYFSLYDRVSVSYQLRIKELRNFYSLRIKVYKGLSLGVAMDHSSVYKDKNIDAVISYSF